MIQMLLFCCIGAILFSTWLMIQYLLRSEQKILTDELVRRCKRCLRLSKESDNLYKRWAWVQDELKQAKDSCVDTSDQLHRQLNLKTR